MVRPKQFKPNTFFTARRSFNGRQAIDNMYDHAWEKYRSRFLKQNPDCYRCSEPATVVDHLTPHKGDPLLFKKLDNHIPLCKRCHDTATQLFDVKYKVGDSVKSKIQWMNWERARLELRQKVKVLPRYEDE